MYIKDIFIDGFGIFHNFSLPNLSRGINLILGENEAGKSTLLKFLQFTLYGYPRETDKRMPPIYGGTHRGRITVLPSINKEELIIERSSGKKGGEVSLSRNGELLEGREQLTKFLGNTDANIYNNIYAFSLQELSHFSSLEESGVEDRLFSISLGLGKTSLNEIKGKLTSRIESLYRSNRSRNQLIPGILDEIQEKNFKISQLKEEIPRYIELSSRIINIERDLKEINSRLTRLKTEEMKLANYIKCHKPYVLIYNLDKELENYPDDTGSLPVDLNFLWKMEEREKALVQSKLEIEKEINQLNQKNQGQNPLKNILQQEDRVNFLNLNLEKYKQAKSDNLKDELKQKELAKSIEFDLKHTGSGLSEKDISSSTDFIYHKDQLKDFKKIFAKLFKDELALNLELKSLVKNENQFNKNWIFNILSIIFLIGAIPSFSYSLPVLGVSFILISAVLFFGKPLIYNTKTPVNREKQQRELALKKKETEDNYLEFLQNSFKISKRISLDSALEILNLFEDIKKEKIQIHKITEQIKSRQNFISDYQNSTEKLWGEFFPRLLPLAMPVCINKLTGKFLDNKNLSDTKAILAQNIEEKEKQLKALSLKLSTLRTQIKNLVTRAKVENKEELKERISARTKRKELSERKKYALATIETIFGPGKGEEVIEFLSAVDKSDLDKQYEQARAQTKNLLNTIDSQKETLITLQNSKNSIEHHRELAFVQTEKETLKEKLKDAGQKWFEYRAALKILNKVKEKYETDKQPQVIKNSTLIFKEITSSKYNNIHISIDKREVLIYDQRNIHKKISQLSRGTREQLFLSLRLGFIEEYEKKGEPLPLIMDEILVNFDPKRARTTAEILNDFAKDRQILFFTCHPQTVDLFKSAPITLNKI